MLSHIVLSEKYIKSMLVKYCFEFTLPWVSLSDELCYLEGNERLNFSPIGLIDKEYKKQIRENISTRDDLCHLNREKIDSKTD